MAAYSFGELVERTDTATVDELLQLHATYMALDEDEHRFEYEDLAPSIAFSLFDLGVPHPALSYIESLEAKLEDGDQRVLWDLGYACIRVKRYEEGERWYRDVLEVAPSKAIAAYNLACNFAMRARDAATSEWRKRFREEALQYLRQSIEEFGYGDWKWMEEDGDLDFIRGEKEYKELLGYLKKKYPERKKGKVAKGRSALGPR
jgi:tetratricopeptide (TPR) repeat protein